jgi:hypothetical protein
MVLSEADSGMPLCRVNCPGCHKPTFLGAGGTCRNVLTSRAICGRALPLQYCDGTNVFGDKAGMQAATQAAGTVAPTYAWTWVADHYARFQEFVMESGLVHLDSASDYFFLWTTRGPDPLATLFYATKGSVVAATGVFMPLDPSRENYEQFFNDYEPLLQNIADGPGLIVNAPDGTHSDFRVYRDEAKPGKLVFLYNPAVGPGPTSD